MITLMAILGLVLAVPAVRGSIAYEKAEDFDAAVLCACWAVFMAAASFLVLANKFDLINLQ
ncbi:hypothetical protein CYG49_01305 [Candidatus Saccharibacteria bacterium]|nr:MAG: hypothetical protein CYG49_01305 [Candidatus Saccharibacteria bacterium]